MLVVASGVFMSTLDTSIVNVSLPTLVEELDAPFAAVQWVVLGYMLVITGLLLPAGRAAEIVGRRRLFLLGFLVFTISSLIAGFAANVWMLVATRAVQGAGAAAMQAISPALLLDAFPARERGRALGMNASAVSLGLLAGPMVGGVVLGTLGWPYIFFLKVPVGVAGILLGLRVLPRNPGTGARRFDWCGSAGLVAGLVALLLGLNQIQRAGLGSPLVVGLLAAAVLVLAGSLWWQRRTPVPTIDLRLFTIREFSAATLAAFLSFSAMASQVLLLPFYLQRVLALPVGQIGLVLGTVPAIMGVLGPISGSLADRFGPRLIASSGVVVSSSGLALLTTLNAQSSALDVVARLAVVGIGIGVFGSANASSLMGAAPPQQRGQAGAMMALARNMAQATGQAVWGTCWALLATLQLGVASTEQAVPAQTVDAFRITFAAAAAVMAIAIVVSMVRGRSPYAVPGVAGSRAGGGSGVASPGRGRSA